MKSTAVLALAGLLACVPPLGAHAQSAVPGLQPGSVVRLSSPFILTDQVVARVEGVTEYTITFTLPEHPDQVWTQRLDGLQTLAINRGVQRGRSAWRGALRGGFLLASVGGIVAPFTGRTSEPGPWQLVSAYGGAGAVLGAGIGAVVGALLAPERWQSYVFAPSR